MAVLAAAVLAVACSPIPDESLGSAPVFSMKGHVDVSKLRTSGKPLFVTLAWGAVPSYPAICLEQADKFPALAAVCGSPFSFVVNQPFPGQPLVVDADGNFTYTLKSLPEASLTVGGQGGRVGYGSFIVYEDLNGTGMFLQGSAGPLADGMTDGAVTEGSALSRVLAASFASLLLPQHRIVLREGAWGVAPFFYPLLGTCEAPPGFSSMTASLSLGDDGSLSGTCANHPASEPVGLLPLSEQDAKQLECGGGRVMEVNPEWMDGPPRPEAVCVDAETMVDVRTDSYCPTAEIIKLKGCWDRGGGSGKCETPDWDLTANPPAWWSCQ